MMAGCKFVGSTLGALPETTGTYSDLVPIDRISLDTKDLDKFVYRYATALDKAIDSFWENDTQEMLREQVSHFNKYYSWEYRKKEWISFLEYSREMAIR